MLKTADKEKKILKADREYRHIVHRGTKIGMIEAFLSDAMQARRQQRYIFKVLKEKKSAT